MLTRKQQQINHRRFVDLINYLEPGDCLVINETKVRPARIKARKITGGAVELLLLKERSLAVWEALCRPARRVKAGTQLIINEKLKAEVVEALTDGQRLVEFKQIDAAGERANGSLKEEILQAAEIALPPYIHKPLANAERYQTVYSQKVGSVAAPTAGLHFTSSYLEQLKAKGVQLAKVVLHIGLDTFRPLTVAEVQEHKMHAEEYIVSQEAANIINKTKKTGRKVVAVGTTVVRALESAANSNINVAKVQSTGPEPLTQQVNAGTGTTTLFIYPGYKFKIVDAMLTNFHLPKSTLLVLVSAFAGLDLIKRAYAEAIKERYRFYSFGDAMLIL